MGKEPVGSRVTIPKSGALCCLGPLFRVNQPLKISLQLTAMLGLDEQEGSLQPGLGTNYLFKYLVNTCQRKESSPPVWGSWTSLGSTMSPTVLPMARPPQPPPQQKVFTARAGVVSSPQGHGFCLSSFLSRLRMLSCTQQIMPKRWFMETEAEGRGNAGKSQPVLAPLSKQKSPQVVFTEDSYSPQWLKI